MPSDIPRQGLDGKHSDRNGVRISLVIPSFRRPLQLARCLYAIAKQLRKPDEVLVAVRDIDTETKDLVRGAATKIPVPIKEVTVSRPGVVHAMNMAVRVSTGDIVALTDDDAEPWPDWLQRIERSFRDDIDSCFKRPLGGVGGRDFQKVRVSGDAAQMLHDGKVKEVGLIKWYGRIIGNHHLQIERPAHVVDVLKGVNCAYLGSLLRSIQFDERLRGRGAEVHWELGLCIAVRRLGYRLMFDPALCVDHYPASRVDGDCRGQFNWQNTFDSAHNETLAFMANAGKRDQYVHLLFAFFVGSRGNPGLLQGARLFLKNPVRAFSGVSASIRGRSLALQTSQLPRIANWSNTELTNSGR